MSGSNYGVAALFDGVQVYYSENVMSQGAYYPENSRDDEVRQPYVVLPPGDDPGAAVAKVKERVLRDAASDMIELLQEAAPEGRVPMFFRFAARLGFKSRESLRTALATRFPELKTARQMNTSEVAA